MLSKSERTKMFILEQSKEVFSKKGYQTVTMTDIVKECGISRGGVYRYFKSTKEIFLAIVEMNQQAESNVLEQGIANNLPATQLLETFLDNEKDHLLQKESNLTVAIYEFYFKHKHELQENWLQNQFNRAEEVMKALLQYGVENNEFYLNNPYTMARHILFLMEGLRISSEAMDLDESMINEQLYMVKSQLIRK